MKPIQSRDALAKLLDWAETKLRCAKSDLRAIIRDQETPDPVYDAIDLEKAEAAVVDAEMQLDEAQGLLEINFETYRRELCQIRSAGLLTWPERQRIQRWLQEGFWPDDGNEEASLFLRLKLSRLEVLR